MNIKPLPIKVFTREEPATKVDIVNAFWDGTAFGPCPVIRSRGIIGLNVPKYLVRKGLAEYTFQKDVEMLRLTRAGEKWLIDGLESHLKRHPGDARRLTHGRPGKPASTRETAAPASPAPTARRITRAARTAPRTRSR